MTILGIETSCDETAAAVVKDGNQLLSSVVASSMDLHVPYGGIVPEIAARSHIESIGAVIEQALTDAKSTWDNIDGIAVTYGAGLGSSLLVGVMAARTLAIIKDKPLYAINHVEGHVYANFITATNLQDYHLRERAPKFPMLAIIVSGLHSQLVVFRNHFEYQLLGQTRDDAIGEAFDKVARMLGLPYPGGPAISQKALAGDPHRYHLPMARMAGKYDFSFSGLKTAVLRLAQAETGNDYAFPSSKLPQALSEAQKADIAASFQYTAVKTIVDKAKLAFDEFTPASVVIAGGVAASPELRRQLKEVLPEVSIEYPDPKLCTDNGAMIAALGCYKATLKQPPADPYGLVIEPNLSM